MTIDRTDTPSPTTGTATSAALRAACGGAVHLPGDPGYDAARQAWNAHLDPRPAAVAYPSDARETGAVVRAARAAGLRVAPQSTGHNAGPLPTLDDVVLLRTSAMREVRIDPVHLRARVGGGVIWEDVVRPAAGFGLATLHGSSPDVGVAGYSLGGGIGWYARQFGMQTNHLTAVELVTADGDLVRADEDHESELFWALRGGGGNFGVVTALEFDLLPVQSAYAGWLVWDWTHAGPVLDAWADWAETAPDCVSTSFRILQLPPIEDVPEVLRGRKIVAIDGAVLADDESARRVIAPLRALRPDLDTFVRMAAVDLVRLHADPEGPTPVVADNCNVAALTPAARDAFVAHAGADSGSSLLMAELRQLGGALGRPDPRAGALPLLHGAAALFALAVPTDAESAARGQADATALATAMTPWSDERAYLNFTEKPIDTRVVHGAERHDRLLTVRRAWDPDGVFLANHPIDDQIDA